IPVHVGRNEGIGFRGEHDTLAPAGQQRYEDLRYRPHYVWGQIHITEVLIEHTKSDRGAFVRALDAEVRGMVRDMIAEVNRILWGDGTGLLAATKANNNTNVIALEDNARMGYFRVGMVVDILAVADGTPVATQRKITAVDKTAKTITIDGAPITTTTDHGVYRFGNYGKVANGLMNVVSNTGNLGGLNPANPGQEFWASHVFSNGGTLRDISEELLQQAFDAPTEESNGEVSLIIGSFGVRRAYQSLLTALRRYVNTMELEGGFSALEFNGKPFTVDKDAPYNTLFLLDETYLRLFETSKPKWMDRDGAVLKYDGNTGWRAIYRWFFNLGTDLRAAHARLDDLREK